MKRRTIEEKIAGNLRSIVIQKNKRISQLERERDFWKKKVREELVGSYYSEERVNEIMEKLERGIKK